MIKALLLLSITLAFSVISGVLEGQFTIKLAKIFESSNGNREELNELIKIGSFLILSSVGSVYLNSYTSWKIWKIFSDFLFKEIRKLKINPRKDISILTNTVYRDSNVVAVQVILPFINATTKLLTIIVMAIIIYPILVSNKLEINLLYILATSAIVISAYFFINKVAWELIKKNNQKKHAITDMTSEYVSNRRSMNSRYDYLIDKKSNGEFVGLAENEGVIMITSAFPKAVIEPMLIMGLVYLAFVDGVNISTAIAGMFLFMRAVPHINQIANGFMTSVSRASPLYVMWCQFKILRENKLENHEEKSKEIKYGVLKSIVELNIEDKNFSLTCDNQISEDWSLIRIIGQSGAGKSTIIEGLMGYHNASGYLVRMIEKYSVWLSESNPIFLSKNITELLKDLDIKTNELKDARLSNFLALLKINNLIVGNNEICYMSLGERQRLKIFENFAYCSKEKFEKQIIIIDEGLSGVPIEMERSIIEFLIKCEIKIILTTHRENSYKEDYKLLAINQ